MPRSECESHLQFQSAVVCTLREDRVSGTGGLICLAEQWRGDVADDRPWIVVIGKVPDPEARTDLSMLLGLLFLMIEGAGPVSLDSRLAHGSGGSEIPTLER